MDLHSYAFNMGAVMANLQSLEFTLRAVLHELPGAPPSGVPHGTDLFALPTGTELPESNLTSYDSLGQLIDKYNRVAPSYGFHEVDRAIVDLRDALAHGRISGAAIEEADLQLVKYSRPRNGRVTVLFSQELSANWFTSQRRRLRDALSAVDAALESLQSGSLKGKADT